MLPIITLYIFSIKVHLFILRYFYIKFVNVLTTLYHLKYFLFYNCWCGDAVVGLVWEDDPPDQSCPPL